jgi:outer membrane protein TolC
MVNARRTQTTTMSTIYRRRSKLKQGFIFFIFIFFLAAAFLLPGEEKKLTMETAVQSALTYNERSAAAEERINASKARLLKARSFFLPTINATGTYTRRPFAVERTINDQTVTIQSLNALAGNITMNLILFDSRSIPLLRQVKLEDKAEKCNSLESKRALSFEVCNAFLVTLSVDQVLKAAQQRYVLAGKNLEASQARYEAQLVSVNDVTRTQLEHAAAESNMTRAEGDVENARLQLEFLLGIPLDDRLLPPEKLMAEAEAPPPLVEQLIPAARDRRLDLHALRWYAKAQHVAAIEPALRWLPSLSLNGSYRYTNESGFTGKATTWTAGLTLNWAVFDGLIRIGDFKERKALAHIADLDLRTGLREVELQVRSALVTLTNQQAALKQVEVALEVAKKNAAETAELYRQGLTGALQAADANVRLYEAEVEFIRARYGLAIAFLNLRMAMGLDPFGKSIEK